MLTPDQIWGEDLASGRQRDLFNRREEAEQLIAYIESVMGRAHIREDKRAYTIAIDARYGEGKSFFLRRFAEHLSLNHPVAFIDAWADDLADEPLTALAATLKTALDPLVDKPEVQERLSDFMSKTGKIAKIIGWGLVRRGAGLVVTGKAVEAAEDVLSSVSEDVREAVEHGLEDIGPGVIDDAVKATQNVSAQALMEKRVAAFEEGKTAVAKMKDSLADVVASLDGQERHPPIVIIIDELDRCRPTYAIKLLEEIKHLFDVAGIVFILALHAEQLGHSVSGAYGVQFDGRAYLRRFIDREYRLAQPSLSPLLEHLCASAGISDQTLRWPMMAISQIRDLHPTLPQLLAEYMKVYGLGARDAFELIDVIQTSTAIVGPRALHLPYFLPLAIGLLKGLPAGQLPVPQAVSSWVYVPNWSRTSSDVTEFTFAEIANAIHKAMSMTGNEFETAREQARSDYALSLVNDSRLVGIEEEEQPVWTIYGYPRLLGTVSRFTNPHLDDSKAGLI